MDKLKRICKCEKLYTLKIDENNICVFNPINSWFNELTNICSLSLTNCKIVYLPDSIGNLKHLWYLDISGTNIKQLPNSFCDLYKLEILDTEHCQLLECFPEGSNKLISMKLLILPELIYDNVETTKVSLVGHMPNLANLIKLKELTFAVTKEKGNTIETLKHINGIYYKMRIVQLENVSNKEEAEQAQLNKKEFVKWLELSWSTIVITDSISNDHEAVLEGLCPHPNLENLEILSYRGENLHPTWLKTEILTNLTTIIIAYCINITTIPCLPHSLTRFDVRGCKRLTSLQDCLVPSNLPSLKRIEIWTCEELVTMAVETFHEFIYLQELRISHCSKLTCQRETVLPLSLKHLYLASCGELEEQFFSSLQNLTSLTRLKIKECPRITSILLENLKSLEKLEISNCSQLQSVGVREHFALKHVSFYSCPKLKSLELGNLKSLEHLELMFCRKLQSIGGQELLASVRYIRISSCQELKSLELDNLKSLERLQLSECSELQSVRARELLVSLKYIRINSCSNLKSLELDNLNSLEKLEVSRCNQLRSIGGLELLASLKYIGIRSCEVLKSLELGNLKSLENLEAMDCSELRSIGGRELLTSVKEINIYLCPKLEETNGKDLEI
ncbi:hypothetical protein LUZ60_005510 [Juncus effusus]|nr:hypothetical protein LUZ60_005510 [Juncus effusus]